MKWAKKGPAIMLSKCSTRGDSKGQRYGLFPLPRSDSDSDSTPYAYIVLFRTFSIAWRAVPKICTVAIRNPNPNPAMEISHYVHK